MTCSISYLNDLSSVLKITTGRTNGETIWLSLVLLFRTGKSSSFRKFKVNPKTSRIENVIEHSMNQ